MGHPAHPGGRSVHGRARSKRVDLTENSDVGGTGAS